MNPMEERADRDNYDYEPTEAELAEMGIAVDDAEDTIYIKADAQIEADLREAEFINHALWIVAAVALGCVLGGVFCAWQGL